MITLSTTTRRIGLAFAFLAMFTLSACTDAVANLSETSQGVVSTDLTTYPVGSNIVVTYSGMSGSTTDWISLALTTDPDDTYEAWMYTGGGTSGSLTFTAPQLNPGTYEARAYYDWADTSSFTIQQTSSPFSITGTGPSASTDMLAYSSGQTVTVSYAGMPGNDLDWVSVAVAGSPITSYVAWDYTNGAVSGSQQFANLPVGTYEARVYLNNSYSLLARSPIFTVGSTNCTPPPQSPVFGSLTSGDIVIASADQEGTAALSVPLGSSILFTSMAENEPSPDHGAVICELTATEVDCRRNDVGTDSMSSTGQINVHWTVVTFTSGVTVQRGEVDTTTTDPADITLTTIDPTQSFIVLGGMIGGGTGWGNNEFFMAQILDAQTLEIEDNVAGDRVAWQVVSMTGASVQRGTTSFATGDTERLISITTVPSGSLMLASYTTDNQNGIAAATLMMQSSFSDPSTIDFKRSLGGSNLSVSWEVVSLPYATDLGLTTFQASEATQTATVAGIATTSAVAIGTTQSILGQSTGSTTYNGSDVDLVGEAAATLSVTAGGVVVTRSTSQSSATIPWTVIDFSKNCAGM